jgi:hypothetical protein
MPTTEKMMINIKPLTTHRNLKSLIRLIPLPEIQASHIDKQDRYKSYQKVSPAALIDNEDREHFLALDYVLLDHISRICMFHLVSNDLRKDDHKHNLPFCT